MVAVPIDQVIERRRVVERVRPDDDAVPDVLVQLP